MSEIERGAGTGQVLYFDCFSGLSGDMVVSALLDLGVPMSVVEDAVRALPIKGYTLRHQKEVRNAISVSRFHVDVEEGKQPHRHFSHIREMIESSTLSESIKEHSVAIFLELAKAEARVHGTTIEKVHFHEVGAVDSIVDIVGAAALFDYLGAQVHCAPVPLGRGFVQTQHGTLPVPAPATLFILEGVQVEGTTVEAELTTPTGAAIIKSTAVSYGPIPSQVPTAIGFGAGTRTLPQRPGILRVLLGKQVANSSSQATCAVIEANIDDMTGEVAAHAMSRLFEAGALDVWFESIQMKKGRPALKVCLLCAKVDVQRMGEALMAHTTTIGLRYYDVGRMEMERSMGTVETPWGTVRVKRAQLGAARNAAVEYEDCARLATESGVPLKQVIAVAAGLAQKNSGEAQ